MAATAGLPFLSAHHPKIEGEGQLDPLGLTPTSDRLADDVLPDITARMRRPRFLTAMTVGTVVTRGLAERFRVEDLEPYLVFEWYLVEAIARNSAARTEPTRNVPGSDKARAAIAAGIPVSAATYLSTPTVFGLHGIYKRFGTGLGVVDGALRCCEAGFRLLQAWEDDNDLAGFGNEDQKIGPGPQFRQMLRDAVADGLKQGQTARSGGWAGWGRLFETLQPDGIGGGERGLLRALLMDERKGPQAEFCRLVRDADLDDPRRVALDERRFFRGLRRRCSETLARSLQAIEAFEDVAARLDDAWRLMLSVSAGHPGVPVEAAEFTARLPAERGPRPLAAAIERATEALAGTAASRTFESLVAPFLGIETGRDYFDAMVRHHRSVQAHKPPEGKRPWIEAAGRGIVVRSAYRNVEPPDFAGAFVERYRTGAVYSLLADLR